MGADRDRLRILITADTVGGVWPFALELSTQLARQGDEVLLAAMGREPDAGQRRQVDEIRGVELHARPYKLVWMQDPWRDLEASAGWLQTLAARFAPDVVHLNDLAHADLAWSTPVLLTAHSCVCSWWQAVHGVPAPGHWNRYRSVVSASLHAADHVVAPTRAMLDMLVRHHVALPSSQVIHNGRSNHSQPDVAKEPFVLAAGRLWDEAKNLGTLAAVAPRLPWPVYLAGETRHPDGGEPTLAATHRLGPVSSAELRGWMARAAIYALPARYEPFGLSALEAAQCGCALVLGDIPSLREVWGDAATFVPPEDHEALDAALRRLIGDDALRTRMAARARTHARRYTPEAMAGRYRVAYTDLVSRFHRAGKQAATHPVTAAAGARA